MQFHQASFPQSGISAFHLSQKAGIDPTFLIFPPKIMLAKQGKAFISILIHRLLSLSLILQSTSL